MAKIRREYKGAAASATTTATMAATGTTSVSLDSATGWPFGSNKFYVVVEPGTANEEKMLVSRASSGDLSIAIASDADRGLDGTTNVSHGSGVTVYPVFTAVDADEANELAAMWESKGDLVSHGAATFARLAVGTNDYVLQADSSTGSGLAWGLVDTDNIAADAVTAAKIAAGAVDSAELASGAVTVDKLDAATLERTVPAGTVVATIRDSADSGWLLLNGVPVTNADSSYPALWAVVPASWKSGSTLVLPDMADRVVAGVGATARGATGGANTVSLVENNLPSHKHTINHGHAHTFTATQDTHNHTVDPASASVSGTVGDNGTDLVVRGDAYNTTYQYAIPYDSNTHSAPYVTNTTPHDGLGMGLTFAAGTVPGMAAAYISSHGHSWSGTVDIPSTTSSSATPAIDIDGSVTNHTGDSGNTGANVAFSVRNSHLALRYQIKAH